MRRQPHCQKCGAFAAWDAWLARWICTRCEITVKQANYGRVA